MWQHGYFLTNHLFLKADELQDSPRFDDDENRAKTYSQAYREPKRLKEFTKETKKQIHETSQIRDDWSPKNFPAKIPHRFTFPSTFPQFRSNPLFLESTKMGQDSQEASTSFEVHSSEDIPIYYKSPSVNIASSVPWRIRASEFRPNPPMRRQIGGYIAKMKKILG